MGYGLCDPLPAFCFLSAVSLFFNLYHSHLSLVSGVDEWCLPVSPLSLGAFYSSCVPFHLCIIHRHCQASLKGTLKVLKVHGVNRGWHVEH